MHGDSESVWFVVWGVVLKWIYYGYKDITLDFDWYAFIGRWRHFFSSWCWQWCDTDDTTDKNCTQWADSTHCVPVVYKFKRDPSELTNRNITLLKTVPSLAFSCCCVWNDTTLGGRDQQRLSPLVRYWTKNSARCLMWLFRKCICFWQLLCSWGMIRRILWKITGIHTNHFACPFMGTLLNMTVFHILRFFHFCEEERKKERRKKERKKRRKKNLERQMTAMTTCQKLELYSTSPLIHILNIAAHLNI